MIVRAAPPAHYWWLLNRVDLLPTTAFQAIEVVDASGQVRGMVGYDHWTPGAVHMHIALDTPGALRSLLYPMFHYPFVQAGRIVALGIINDGNERSKQLARRVGFREVYRIRDGLRAGVDNVIFELRKEECRYLRRGGSGGV